MILNNSNYENIISFNNPSTTNNSTKSILDEEAQQVYTIGRTILLFMFTSNIIGNISVLCVTCNDNQKKRMRFFIMNLAVTDLFVAIGGILPELILNLTVSFYAPEIICRIVKYMSTFASYASSFALVVLSIDRAEAVINPLRSAKQTCCGTLRPRYLALSGWIAASVCGSPSIILAYLVNLSSGPMCYLNFKYISPRVYLTSVAVTVFVLPAFFITLCHVIMVARIWQVASSRNKDLNASTKPKIPFPSKQLGVPTGENELTRIDSFVYSKTENKTNTSNLKLKSLTPKGCIPRARVKTVKMTLVIVSVYIICWCPYMIWNLLITFGVIGIQTLNFTKISPLIQHLVTLNSSANPVIFWIFSAHTIASERKKIRRSKVVQRHHRRWSCRRKSIIIGGQDNIDDT